MLRYEKQQQSVPPEPDKPAAKRFRQNPFVGAPPIGKSAHAAASDATGVKEPHGVALALPRLCNKAHKILFEQESAEKMLHIP